MGTYITSYADERNWENEWQREYKYGIILVLPPEPHRSRINELRRRYAPSEAESCDAHISLSVQVPRPVTAAHVAEVRDKLRTIEPFAIQYGPLVVKPAHRGVILEIGPQDTLEALLKTVEATCLFEGALKRKYPYRAHMTITEFVTWEQTYQIIEELKDLPLSGEFMLNYLSYIVPDDAFRFTERAKIPLGTQEFAF